MMEPAAIKKKIVQKLKDIYDPELPVSVVDLGLIYGVEVDSNNIATITMTLTTPKCPVAEAFPNNIRTQVEQLQELQGVDINLVWEPPWNRKMMSQAARSKLGL